MAKKQRKLDVARRAGSATGTSVPQQVSSPAATGGAGTLFEQHVDAYWLAQLLVAGFPPILIDCLVVEVQLQTERSGWRTDDFLVIGQNGAGDQRKLAGQVKRSLVISAANEECQKTIRDFWQDFSNPQLFSASTDRFALVTLRGTTALLEHFSGLLDCSRVARDASEFERLLATPGTLNEKAIGYCTEIRNIIGESRGKDISEAEVWPFLRVLYVLSLDLNSSTRQTEAVIKSLLAHTTGEHDAVGVAEATWNALIALAGDGMPRSQCFRYTDLPARLRQRHSPLGSTEQRALRSLRDHSAPILNDIRTTIGESLHLPRRQIVQHVLSQLQETRVVLISGVAGSGKSAVAKDAVAVLDADHFVFSFRAEEFAHVHLDETLHASQIPANVVMLKAILAGQSRKILLVESVERLLEKSTRDAFFDLLTLVAADRTWSLVLTCRSYSSDLVRTSLLEARGIEHSVVTVPPLDDEELMTVAATYPTLARPLACAALQSILCIPYYLDKALKIPWSEDRPLPQSEREFRDIFWQVVVRADQNDFAGMSRRREEAFTEVALRRARALDLYAPCGDLDPGALDALRRDSLVVLSKHSRSLVAPAHDVLEDWAILQWIDGQFAVHGKSLQATSSALGTHPAIRRAYRNWVSELTARDLYAADELFQSAVQEQGIPAHFRDDTLVALLHSPVSVAFLQRHAAQLFAADKELLRRIIHLLRVACVMAPPWLKTSATQPSLFSAPDGPAWACVLQLVHNSLASFADEDRDLLLGLLDDWANGVSWQTPYPDGAECAAGIAHWLLPRFDDYQAEDQLRRTLTVIAKIPKADRDRFAKLLQMRDADKEHGQAADFLREMVLQTIEGFPAGRDVPDVIVAASKAHILCYDADLSTEWGYSADSELELLFGIKQDISHDYFPASGYRGPFLALLRHHPGQGLDLMVAVFNHSANWYVHRRVPNEYFNVPSETVLAFADGSTRKVWCDERLWGLYRGTQVGPEVLQSLLMAFERWLLEFAGARSRDLDKLLLHILQRTDSGAIVAIIASVATAFPLASGETLLTLLQSPLCVQLDRHRLVYESQVPSGLFGRHLTDAGNRVYVEERKQSDALSHRRQDIEFAILNLQLGAFRSRVHRILDGFRKAMPPIDEQHEEHRLWRLAMDRMDIRRYSVSAEAKEQSGEGGDEPCSNGQQNIRLELKEPDPDVKEMADHRAADYQAMNAKLALLMWAVGVFEHGAPATSDPAEWRRKLQEACGAKVEDNASGEHDLGRGGPGFVAAVCIRDHWEEMSTDEQAWCLDRACSEVANEADHWTQLARIQQNGMSADRPCAWALPLLLGKSVSQSQRARVRQMLVVGMTHAIDEVRLYAAWGIGDNLWRIDRDLALCCVHAIAEEATMVQCAVDAESSRPYPERRALDGIEADAARAVRGRCLDSDAIANDAYQNMDTATWMGADADKRILMVLRRAPTEAMANIGFERLAKTFVMWWDQDHDRRRHSGQHRRQRNWRTDAVLAELLEDFLLRTTITDAQRIIRPIIDATDRHPDEVHLILSGLVISEDRQPNTPQFWSLWEMFAQNVRKAKWLSRIDDRHAGGRKLMTTVFLGSGWKGEVRHWRSLEGHSSRIHALFGDLPASATVLRCYIQFLYHVGEQSLPDAFIGVAKRLRLESSQQMVKSADTVVMLELLLQRHVYGRPGELKRKSNLAQAVLFLLDLLVEHGSSAAFRMRDDFVTSAPTA